MTSRIWEHIAQVALATLLALLVVKSCRADTTQFLAMCEAADNVPNQSLLHGYCEGYVAATRAMAGTQGEDGVCVGQRTDQEVLYSVVWRIDSLVKQDPALGGAPPVNTVSATLSALYPCGSGKTTPLRRHR